MLIANRISYTCNQFYYIVYLHNFITKLMWMAKPVVYHHHERSAISVDISGYTVIVDTSLTNT